MHRFETPPFIEENHFSVTRLTINEVLLGILGKFGTSPFIPEE